MYLVVDTSLLSTSRPLGNGVLLILASAHSKSQRSALFLWWEAEVSAWFFAKCIMLTSAEPALHTVQGHFQIVFSTEHCPLFQRNLPWFQRLMYCSGVWSYIVGAITTPVFNAIPLVTIRAGVFPIVVSWWAAGEAVSPVASM